MRKSGRRLPSTLLTADARNNAKSCENRDLIFTRTKTVDAFDRRCPQQCETLRNCERTNFHKGLPGEAGPTVIGRWLALPPLTLARCRCWCCLAWRKAEQAQAYVSEAGGPHTASAGRERAARQPKQGSKEEASRHAVSMKALHRARWTLRVYLSTRVLRNFFPRAVTLLCVRRAALNIFTRTRALLQVQKHAAALWCLGPIHVSLTLRVCVCMYLHRRVHSLALSVLLPRWVVMTLHLVVKMHLFQFIHTPVCGWPVEHPFGDDTDRNMRTQLPNQVPARFT